MIRMVEEVGCDPTISGFDSRHTLNITANIGDSMRLFLWDAKYKTWDSKYAKIGVGLSEFNQGSFGLGFDWYHTSGPMVRYGHYACLNLQFLWVELSLFADWGNKKPQHDERLRKYRETRTKLVNKEKND